MVKKAVDIEGLLRWAYRDELPKAAAEGSDRIVFAFRTGWGGVEKFGELMALVQEPDIRNRFGLFPDRFATTEPHPDALRVHAAVDDLRHLEFEMPEGWNPIADMGDLGPEGGAAVARGLAGLTVVNAAGKTVLRRSLARLVMRQAILGGCPCWEGDVPERRLVTDYGKVKWFRRVVMMTDGAFGPVQQELEVDGFNHKLREPYGDAYTKTTLDPDPAPVVQGRAEYELWRAALDVLVEALAGALESHEVTPCPRSARPWEVPDPRRRILPSLLVAAASRPDARPAPRKKKPRAA